MQSSTIPHSLCLFSVTGLLLLAGCVDEDSATEDGDLLGDEEDEDVDAGFDSFRDVLLSISLAPYTATPASNAYSIYGNHLMVGDFDSDGKVDDILHKGWCAANVECWIAHINNGGQFQIKSFGGNMWNTTQGAASTPMVGDFDSDGHVDDVVYWGKCGTGVDCWRVHRGTGFGFAPADNMGDSMWFRTTDARSTPVVGDFDNDGREDDIVYYGKCGYGSDCWRVHRGNGLSFAAPDIMGDNMWFRTADARSTPVSGDFDNDGFNDDIAYLGNCDTGGYDVWRVHRSNGSWFSATDCYEANAWFAFSDSRSTPFSGDFDGDGFKDDIAYYGLFGQGTHGWRIHIGNGSGGFTVTTIARSIGSASLQVPVAGHLNGNTPASKMDMAFVAQDTAWSALWGWYTASGLFLELQ